MAGASDIGQREFWRRAAVLYLTAQGIGVFIWWLILLARPSVRGLFFPPGTPDSVMFAFVLPDSIMLGSASLAAAWGIRIQATWSWPLMLVQAGGSVYAGA